MPYATYRFNKIIAAETIRFIVTVAIVVYKGLKLVVYRMLTKNKYKKKRLENTIKTSSFLLLKSFSTQAGILLSLCRIKNHPAPKNRALQVLSFQAEQLVMFLFRQDPQHNFIILQRNAACNSKRQLFRIFTFCSYPSLPKTGWQGTENHRSQQSPPGLLQAAPLWHKPLSRAGALRKCG